MALKTTISVVTGSVASLLVGKTLIPIFSKVLTYLTATVMLGKTIDSEVVTYMVVASVIAVVIYKIMDKRKWFKK